MKVNRGKLSNEEINKYIRFLRTRGLSDESIMGPVCEYLLSRDASGMVELLLENTSGDDYVKTLLLVEDERGFFR